MNLAELESKILSFGVNYTEKNNRIENKTNKTRLDIAEYSYNSGFINALSLVMQDLERLEK